MRAPCLIAALCVAAAALAAADTAASPHVAPAAAEPLATAADAAHVAHHPTHGAGGAAPTATDDSSDEDSSAQMFKDASELLATGDTSDAATAAALLRDAAALQGSGASAAKCALARLHEDGVPGAVAMNLSHAVQLYNESASLGNATAQFTMGVLHTHGLFGVPKNDALAVLYYHFAALGGSPEAQLALGYRHQRGFHVAKRCSTAVLYYELAANAAMEYVLPRGGVPPLVPRIELNDDAMDELGDTDAKHQQIVAYYENLAEKMDPHVLTMLGQLSYYGAKGVPQSFEHAAKYFLAAAERGDAVASANVGEMYAHGRGLKQDFEAAKAFLQYAADQGEASAINSLGYLHLMGYGFPRRPKIARDLFKQAAEAGSTDASYNIGLMNLQNPAGKDFQLALTSLTVASNQNHLPAMFKLAQMYHHGLGTAQSCTKAVSLYERVARKGPWLKTFARAYSKLLADDVSGSLLEYTRAAEMGYVRAQSSAAYLLDKVVSAAFQENDDSFSDVVVLAPDASALPESVADDSGRDPAEPHPEATAPPGAVAAQARALQLYTQAADQFDISSMVRLGDFYWYGLGNLSEPSYTRAASFYRRAADEGRNAQALYNLGYMHETGLGLPKDHHLAKRYFDEAREANPAAAAPVAIATARLWAVRVFSEWWDGPAAAPRLPLAARMGGRLSRAGAGVWDAVDAMLGVLAKPLGWTTESVLLAVLVASLCNVLYVRSVRRAYVDAMFRRRAALLALQRHRQRRAAAPASA